MGGLGLLNLIPQLPDFAGAGMNYGIFRKMRDDYASQVRHLRRREYQDMMFSMRKAGLNPILAAGATPGHSAAMVQGGVASSPGAGVGSAVAANRQAGVAESKAPSEVFLNQKRGEVEDLRRFNVAEGTARIIAERKQIEANTNLLLQESGTAAVKRMLMQREAERAGWSSKQIQRELEGSTGGNVYQDPLGYLNKMLRQYSTSAKEIAR